MGSPLPGVRELACRIRDGLVSPCELIDDVLNRIDVAADLNAFHLVLSESARREAIEAERRLARGGSIGPLHGVPLAVKDNIDVAGVPTDAGSAFANRGVAPADAAVVARLRAAGAIVVGKLNLAEWAIGPTSHNVHFGPVRNPWQPDRVPGGSSGGSAAAVAADLVPAALGSDTGGSLRVPAALSGVAALRSTVGLVSTRGIAPVSWTLDVVGPMARSVTDLSYLLDVLSGYDDQDVTSIAATRVPASRLVGSATAPLRMGVLSGEPLECVDGEILDLVDNACDVFGDLGVQIEPVELAGARPAREASARIMLAEAAAVHRDRLEHTPEQFAPDVRARLEYGAAVTGPQYGLARQMQRRWTRTLARSLARHDLILAPSSGRFAPLIEGTDPVLATAELMPLAAMFSLCRLPVLALPCGFGRAGLPAGMQLVGRPWEESTALAAGAAYQTATDWHRRVASRWRDASVRRRHETSSQAD